MKPKSQLFFCFTLTLALITAVPQAANAQRPYKSIYNFSGPDGADPTSGTIRDSVGNLYGTASFGGRKNGVCTGCGTAFQLSQTPAGGWTRAEIYRFTGHNGDGFEPVGGLVADASGNLYGATNAGGANGMGTVFEISPASGGGWTETVIYAFGVSGSGDGSAPSGGVVFDSVGNLYGTTMSGGNFSRGTVFELSPASGGNWTESVLYSFGGQADGWNPEGILVLDGAGNLYGTTFGGGDFTSCGNGCGVVFELSPSATGWTETVLHSFIFSDGQNPTPNLLFEASGNLYGTTYWGGNNSEICHSGGQRGCGVVFKLTPTASGPWTSATVFTFDSTDGASPASLAFDAAGNLYGTTLEGGAGNGGNVFRLVSNSTGGWTQQILHSFSGGTSGGGPVGLSFDAAGNLFGSAQYGGSFGWGLIFEIRP